MINNGACTPITPGIWERFTALDIPLLDIHMSGEFADMVHTYFFEHHAEILGQPIELVPTEDWLSINAVGYDWRTLHKVMSTIGKPQPAYLAGRSMHGWGRVFGDEGVFQTLPRIIVKGFTAAHLTFGPQNPSNKQLATWRRRYAEVGQSYLASAAVDYSEPLPDLSPVSCAGPRSPKLPSGPDWRTRWAGENDPTAGRYKP